MPTTSPTVAWIAMAPVKSMALQVLDAAHIGPHGIPGDRRFALLDPDGRLANAKRYGPLALIQPRLSADGTHLALHFPDATVAEADLEHTQRRDGIFYGQPRAAHHLAGPFDDAISGYAHMPLRLVEMERPGDGLDRADEGGSVSIASVAALGELAYAGGLEDPLDHRRFRMTIGVAGVKAYAEDGWVGHEVVIGGATVRPAGNVGRCAVTTHDPDLGRPTFDTLRYLSETRGHLPSTEKLPFGVWASVVTPGDVRVGDPVVPPPT